MKSIAVITDATSAGFYFPRWRDYYGRLFGMQNLHVVTYSGMRWLFDGTGVGNVWELNCGYDDKVRSSVIADFVTVLLNTYDVVLRCDVDEMLVPDPARFPDLAAFVQQNDLPYVTARGIDVIELTDDPDLVPNVPILGRQRRYGTRSSAGNKTCLTTIPMRWAAGFHAASAAPRFSGLYNFHLKSADLRSRIAWHDLMAATLDQGTGEYRYFNTDREHLTALQQYLSSLPRMGTEHERAFDQRFLDTVRHNKTHDVYEGDFISQDFLFRIDESFDDRV